MRTQEEAPDFVLYEPDHRFRDETTFTGRGVGVDGRGGKMVLVSLGSDNDPSEAMISQKDFEARLEYHCPHNLKGWSCKDCLCEEEVRRLV